MTERQKEILRHMLGADSKNPGYRNRYVATFNGEEHKILDDMQSAGLVTCYHVLPELAFFSATEAGCRAAGLNDDSTRNAMGG